MDEIPQGIRTFTELMGGEAEELDLHDTGLPMWVSDATQGAYEIKWEGDRNLTFIEPDPKLSFDRIAAIVKSVRTNIKNAEPMIIADNLNPKFRGLFVRERIPFVNKNDDIFAPNLATKLSHVSTLFETCPDRKIDELNPFAVKLIAGTLTGFLPKKRLKVNEAVEQITKAGGEVVAPKVSIALKELNYLELIVDHGRGPEKYYELTDPQTAFEKLLNLQYGRLYKKIENFVTLNSIDYVLSGESAVANYTNLNEPKKKTIAVYKQKSGDLKQRKKVKVALGLETIQIEMWREDPHLFSVDGKINPIELCFSVGTILDDPRVHTEMNELLEKYGLKLLENVKING